MQEIILKTSDGVPLSARIFEPAVSNGKLLLINSATGVKQQIYFSFAKFFAQNGFTVITYDYRGIGESKPKKLKNSRASMRIWGATDFKTVTAFIQKNYPQHQKFCLGHSVGALIIGMNRDAKIFDQFVFVATQDAYFGNLNFKVALTALLGFGLAVPLTAAIFGYFPAHRFDLGESLPKGVAYDWRTLILTKKSTTRLYEKLGGDFSKKLTQPTFVLHAEDDSWVTEKGMKSLMKNVYPDVQAVYREIKTAESPANEIGHVNFFRTFNRELWNVILAEL